MNCDHQNRIRSGGDLSGEGSMKVKQIRRELWTVIIRTGYGPVVTSEERVP